MISPFGNVTVLPEAKWNPEPTNRGTFGILSSCLITMTLCIWTAVHLNLPEHKKEWQQVYRKMLWLVIGLLAPEVVVWNAWEQRKIMKQLSDHMRSNEFMAKETSTWQRVRDWFQRASAEMKVFLLLKAQDWPEPASSRKRQRLYHDRIHPWTDVHSWYAVMGGFAFEDTADEEFQFMPGDRTRLVLSIHGFGWMTASHPRLLPDISVQHILDKSKSGGLGKFLTCWQATYFCAQCIFRISRQYSISLLELNVFAHALCALILFWIWWDKPQDVHEPTLITDNDGLDACAYFSLREHLPGGLRSRWIPCQPCSNAWEVFAPAVVTLHHQHRSSVGRAVPLDPYSLFKYAAYFLFGPNRQPCLKVQNTFWALTEWDYWRDEDRICKLDNRCIRRLVRTYSFVKEHGFPHGAEAVVDRCPEFHRISLIYLSYIVQIWHSRMYDKDHDAFRWAVAGLTLAGGCYGGLHLTAWNCQFPSHAETLLWRAASITIMTTGPSYFAYALCYGVLKWVTDFVPNWQITSPLGSIQPVYVLDECVKLTLHTIFYYLWGLWYVLCRTFIVVECFIMLAHLPDTALEISSWAAYIPHIT